MRLTPSTTLRREFARPVGRREFARSAAYGFWTPRFAVNGGIRCQRVLAKPCHRLPATFARNLCLQRLPVKGASIANGVGSGEVCRNMGLTGPEARTGNRLRIPSTDSAGLGEANPFPPPRRGQCTNREVISGTGLKKALKVEFEPGILDDEWLN